MLVMSEHEFEDLVEWSVIALAATDRPWRELRSLYWNLYRFKDAFDTGFTHFRNLDQLLAAHFVYRFPIAEHPEYVRHQAWFDGIDDFAFIREPGPARDGGYVLPPHVYCDAGSPLWARLVASGRLRDDDAEAPYVVEMDEIARDIARIAEANGDRELVATWYRLLLPYLLYTVGGFTEVRERSSIAELRAIVRRTDAMAIPMTYGALRDPDPDDLAESPDLQWWYAV
jgi:hypothetical protein